MKHLLHFILVASCFTLTAQQLPQLNLVPVGSGFASPVDIKNAGDERIFIVEQAGRIRIMDKKGHVNATPFLDIHTEVLSAGNEQGLLSVAFGPTFLQDGYFYVNYIFGSGAGNTRISRFKVSSTNPDSALASSEKVLVTFVQPYINHNGATLMFGADGYLYDTQGDGGSGGDPQNHAQDTTAYLGKILRMDVSNHDTTYLIPPTNPFVGDGVANSLIWAYGLRNPFRCSFDRLTHDMWIGDVGQNAYEEVDFQPANSTGKQNYGWRCREGFHAYDMSLCNGTGYTDPIFEYAHTGNGCAIIGGYVYRGALFSKLYALYLFTDNCSGKFWSLKQTSPGVFDPDTLQTFLANEYTTLGEDNRGEIYVAGRTNGVIYHLTDTSTCLPVALITTPDSLTPCNTETLSTLPNDSLTYQWYNSSGAIDNATSNQYTAGQTGWYKVMVSKAQPGCSVFSDSVFVLAYDTAELSFTNLNLSYCRPADTVHLDGAALPTGGVFTGTGVGIGDVFDPSLADTGVNVITYTYTNLQGCTSTGSLNITVYDTTVLAQHIGTTQYCQNAPPFLLDGFVQPTGGTYSGNGVDAGIFTAANAQVGSDTITYTYIDNHDCVSTTSFALGVNVCTAIEDMANSLQFTVLPNPNNGNFKIQLSNTTGGDILVSDVMGKEYARKPLPVATGTAVIPISISGLSAGVYLLQLKTGEGLAVRKFVVE